MQRLHRSKVTTEPQERHRGPRLVPSTDEPNSSLNPEQRYVAIITETEPPMWSAKK